MSEVQSPPKRMPTHKHCRDGRTQLLCYSNCCTTDRYSPWVKFMEFYFALICLFLSHYCKYFSYMYSPYYIVLTVACSHHFKVKMVQVQKFWQTLKIWSKTCVFTSVINWTKDITLVSQIDVWFPMEGEIYPWCFHLHCFLRNKRKLGYFLYSFENAKQL